MTGSKCLKILMAHYGYPQVVDQPVYGDLTWLTIDL